MDVPAATAVITERKATSSETREPTRTRLNTSRPNSSVPKRYRPPGGASASCGAIARTSCGAMTGASAATSTLPVMMTRPMGATLLRRKRRAHHRQPTRTRRASAAGALAVADAWVDPGIEEIHHQIGDHEQERHHQHHALHHGIVALEDRLQHQPAHAGQREDLLDHHRAAQQVAHLEADDG